MLGPYLEQVIDGRDLSRDQARDAMRLLMTGDADEVQIGGLLVALRAKGETIEEIAGFAEAMRELSSRVDLGVEELVDTCGTGGDGGRTFNVSTAAAIVAAGAGVPIAKHGNRSVSSPSGSADLLEALGVRLIAEPDALRRSLRESGIAFLYAPAQHPAMRHAIGPRRRLGLRTVFNLLGPLTNPAGARRQVLGVYDDALVEPVARALGRLGARHVLVVHGAGGLDEISTLGPTRFAECREGRLEVGRLEPADLGLDAAMPGDLAGGSAGENAAIVRAILDGEPGPRREIVLANAGAAIYVSGRVDRLRAGVELAARSIDDGAARRVLDRLIDVTAGEGS